MKSWHSSAITTTVTVLSETAVLGTLQKIIA